MSCCVIFGGSEFIGTQSLKILFELERITKIHINDIQTTPLKDIKCVYSSKYDASRNIFSDFSLKEIAMSRPIPVNIKAGKKNLIGLRPDISV